MQENPGKFRGKVDVISQIPKMRENFPRKIFRKFPENRDVFYDENTTLQS